MSSLNTPVNCVDDPVLQTLRSSALTPEFEGPTLRLDSADGASLALAPVPGPDDPVAVITDYGNGRGYLSLTMPVGRHCDERVTRVDQTASTELTVVVDLDSQKCPGSAVTAEFGHVLRTMPDPGRPTTVLLSVDARAPIAIVAAWNPS
jgi:hypothetical protein